MAFRSGLKIVLKKEHEVSLNMRICEFLCFRFILGHVYVVVDLVIISTLTFQIEDTAWKKLTRLKKSIRIISVIIFHDRILDAYTILLLF